MVMRFLLALCSGALLLGQPSSLVLTPGLSAQATGNYSSATNLRVEIRFDNLVAPSDYSWIFQMDSIMGLRAAANQSLLWYGFSDGLAPANGTTALSGWKHMIVRAQRDYAAAKWRLEYWNLDTSEHFSAADVAFTPSPMPLNRTWYLGGTYTTGQVAYLRIYSNVVTPGSAPDSTAGDLADWEFNRAVSDSAGRANWSAFSSSPTYVTTDVISGPPFISAVGPFSARANTTVTLQGDGSFSPNGGSLTYAWTQISGPANAAIATPTAPNTTVTGLTTFGTYVFRLTINDGSQTNQSDVTIGAVPSDDKGHLTYYTNAGDKSNDPEVHFLVGDLMRWGTSGFDDMERLWRQYSDNLEWHIPVVGQTAESGTVHMHNANGAWRVVCDTPGTCHFAQRYRRYSKASGLLTTIAVSGNVATATTSVPHAFLAGRFFTISGSSTPALNGRYIVSSVPSGTTFTFATSGVPDGVYTDAGLLVRGGHQTNSGNWYAYFCHNSCPGWIGATSNNYLTNIVVSGATATATTSVPHGIRVGENVLVGSTGTNLDSATRIVTAVPSETTFQFSALPVRAGVVGAANVANGTYTADQMQIAVEETDLVWVWYDAPGDHDGKHTEQLCFVAACGGTDGLLSDDEILTLTNNLQNPFMSNGSIGHQWSVPSNNELGAWTSNNNPLTYYDAPLGAKRMWLVTGRDEYQVKFANIADAHWKYSLDHGYGGICYGEMRCDATISTILRANEAHPEWWTGILYHQGTGHPDQCATQTVPLPQGYGFSELRDASYNLRYEAAIARSARKADATVDTANRATYCSYTRQCVNNVFKSTQMSNGAWRMDPSIGNKGYPYFGPGVYPWMMGLTTGSLAYVHALMTDSSSCSGLTDRSAVATDALNMLKGAVDFQLSQAFDDNLGSFYGLDFTWGPDGFGGTPLAGTVFVTNGNASVSGSGTTFARSFLPDGTTMLTTDDTHVLNGNEVVQSVASDTSMTLAHPWGFSSANPTCTNCFQKTSSCSTLAGTGTLSFHQNSQTVNGDGSVDLRTLFLPDGTTYVQPYSYTDRRTWRVSAVTANTLTLQTAWANRDLSTSTWRKVSGGCTDVCGSRSKAASCLGSANGGGIRGDGDYHIGDTGSNPEQLPGIAYYYAKSGAASYLTQVSPIFGATFTSSSIPWYGNGDKPYGQAFGAGNEPNYLALVSTPNLCAGLTVSPTSHNSSAGADSGSIAVTVPDQTCSWSANAGAAWVTLSNGSGTGNGTIDYTVTANQGTARSTTISIDQGGTLAVTQDSGCSFSISPTTTSAGATGGPAAITVTASDASCGWTASSSDLWLPLNKTSGTGTDSVNILIGANSGGLRTGVVSVAGYNVTVTQAGSVGTANTSISGGASFSGDVKLQ